MQESSHMPCLCCVCPGWRGAIKNLLKTARDDAESLAPSLLSAIAVRGDRGTRMRVKIGKYFY